MLDTSKMRAAIDATPGDDVVFSKAHIARMLAEIELGNAARQTLVSIGSIARLQGCSR